MTRSTHHPGRAGDAARKDNAQRLRTQMLLLRLPEGIKQGHRRRAPEHWVTPGVVAIGDGGDCRKAAER